MISKKKEEIKNKQIFQSETKKQTKRSKADEEEERERDVEEIV